MDLRAYRKSRCLSQEEVARAVGVTSKGYISDIERGERKPSLLVALRLEQWSSGILKAADLCPAAASVGAVHAKPKQPHPSKTGRAA